MKSEHKTFESVMNSFGNQHDLKTVFDDFVTMSLYSFAPNMETGLSFYELDYLALISKYQNPSETRLFPKLLQCLVDEMEERQSSDSGWDILGEFFEQHIATDRKSQFFTPWPICQ